MTMALLPKHRSPFGPALILALMLSLETTTRAYLPKLAFHRGTAPTPTGTAGRSLFAPPVLRYIDQDDVLTLPLPSMKQVTTDSFTEQTYHASMLLGELFDTISDRTDGELQELMMAQLSHQDGMRGFLAVYLTRDFDREDNDQFPAVLTQVIKGVNMTQMAPLACMNVIRATAMAHWHTDPTLKVNSFKTADRAHKFLRSLPGSISVIKNCEAIHAVASEGSDSTPILDSNGSETTEKQTGLFFASYSNSNKKKENIEVFWEDILNEGGYDEEQRKLIAAAFSTLI